MAVVPSALIETAAPCLAAPVFPVPTNLAPRWLQVVPLRVKTHAAP